MQVKTEWHNPFDEIAIDVFLIRLVLSSGCGRDNINTKWNTKVKKNRKLPPVCWVN